VRRAEEPQHLHVSTILISDRVNLLERTVPVQACTGIALAYQRTNNAAKTNVFSYLPT